MTATPTRVYLTGADGMLGRTLAAALGRDAATAGWRVHGVSVRDFDIRDAAAVHASMSRVRPHLVVHAAANAIVDECETDPGMALRVNVDGTRHVTEAAREHGSRLVYVSSDYVFGGDRPPPGGYREDDVPGPVNIYGLTKLAGERVVQTAPRHLVIRTSWLFGGPDEGTDQVLALVRRAVRGEPVELIVDQFSRPTYTVHLARAIARLLAHAPEVTGTVHLANAGSASWYQLGTFVSRCLAARTDVADPPPPVPVRLLGAGFVAARPRDSTLNTERAAALGVRMPGWEEAVREYCAALVDARAEAPL